MKPGRNRSNLPPDQLTSDESMDLYESNTHSFIVKVWLEQTAQEAGRAAWRGHITHVQSGERRYVQYLYEISAFITTYLKKMGVDMRLGVWEWFKRWIRR